MRAQQEFRDAQSRVGGIFTMVDRDLSAEATRQVLPSRAYTGGIDFEHTWSDREWALWGFLAGSRVKGSPEAMLRLQRSSNHYYQRPDQDYLELDSTRTSLSGAEWRLEFERRSGEHWTGAVWAAQRTPGFEINDLGFSRSTERLDGGARIGYREREPGSWYQSYGFNFFTFHNWRHEALDDVLSASQWGDAHKNGQASLNGDVTLRNWWSLRADIQYSPEVLSDVMTRGGPLMIEPGSWAFDVGVNTDRRDALSYGTSFEWERGSRGGGSVSADFDVDFRPTSGVSLSLGPNYTRSTDPAQYVTQVDDCLVRAHVRHPLCVRRAGARGVDHRYATRRRAHPDSLDPGFRAASDLGRRLHLVPSARAIVELRPGPVPGRRSRDRRRRRPVRERNHVQIGRADLPRLLRRRRARHVVRGA
ncbi:MAG: DUF5916 domain-containing protein [Gemmatimonadota bacterium]|nr:DUF5916 domain-containing protein [Gemmatimonadota bacterium]